MSNDWADFAGRIVVGAALGAVVSVALGAVVPWTPILLGSPLYGALFGATRAAGQGRCKR